MLQELKTILTTLFTVILVGGGLYLWQGQPAATASSFPSMVKVIMMGPSDKSHELAEIWHGSGVIVGPHTIVTAKHVADFGKEGKLLKIVTQDGKTYTVDRVQLDPKNDFAILTVKETLPNVAPTTCKPVNPTDTVYVVGYPLDFEAMIYVNTVVSYIKDGDVTVLTVTGVSLPGDSGGPVFNKNGELVGILVGEFIYQDSNSFNGEDSDLNIVVPLTETMCKGVV